MWIRTKDGFDAFITTAAEGDYEWRFDGETYSLTPSKGITEITTRYSIMIRLLRTKMPNLWEARKRFLALQEV